MLLAILISLATQREMVRGVLLLKCMLLMLITAPASAQEVCRLAVLGDSLTAGYGLQVEDAFPAVLERALRDQGRECEVVDAGVSGDTTAGGASRVNWVLADQPTHLMVELGGNDALRALPPQQMKNNLRRIIVAAETEGVPVMLAGMLPPPNLGEAYFQEFEQVFADLANQYDLYLYPFFLEGVALETSLMQADGIHPNEQGVREIVDRILPITQEFLDTGGPTRTSP